MGMKSAVQLILVCDHQGCNPVRASMFARSLQGCFDNARDLGWIINPHRDAIPPASGSGACYCPDHRPSKLERERIASPG